jgi:hypothetical protein
MDITATPLKARAKATIQQHRPTLDPKTGLTSMELVGEVESLNLVTDGGRVAIHTYVYGTSAQRTSAGLGTGLNYIAMSDDAAAPVAGDTTLAGEISTNGLGRAQGTVTLPTGSGTITQVSRQFTYTGGSSQQVQKTALFDAVSAGKMAHEIQFTPRTLLTNDQLTVTFSITLA